MSSKTDLEGADSRVLKSAREVLRRGHFVRHSPDSESRVRFSIVERGGTSTVTADPAWTRPPVCDCYDHRTNARFRSGEWCRHIVAVLAKEEDLRCQLIDLLL
jgi:predicted nucleic acid-binding Zn finger protein